MQFNGMELSEGSALVGNKQKSNSGFGYMNMQVSNERGTDLLTRHIGPEPALGITSDADISYGGGDVQLCSAQDGSAMPESEIE